MHIVVDIVCSSLTLNSSFYLLPPHVLSILCHNLHHFIVCISWLIFINTLLYILYKYTSFVPPTLITFTHGLSCPFRVIFNIFCRDGVVVMDLFNFCLSGNSSFLLLFWMISLLDRIFLAPEIFLSVLWRSTFFCLKSFHKKNLLIPCGISLVYNCLLLFCCF